MTTSTDRLKKQLAHFNDRMYCQSETSGFDTHKARAERDVLLRDIKSHLVQQIDSHESALGAQDTPWDVETAINMLYKASPHGDYELITTMFQLAPDVSVLNQHELCSAPAVSAIRYANAKSLKALIDAGLDFEKEFQGCTVDKELCPSMMSDPFFYVPILVGQEGSRDACETIIRKARGGPPPRNALSSVCTLL